VSAHQLTHARFYTTGNVYQRNKAIAAFQKSVDSQPKKAAKGKEPEPLPRVLMLSLVHKRLCPALLLVCAVLIAPPTRQTNRKTPRQELT
jgi:hypothetical protein